MKTFGLKGEIEYGKFMERQYRRLEEKDTFVPLDEI